MAGIVLMHYIEPHTTGVLHAAVSFGGAGVHLFFFLSGWGLAGSLQMQPLVFYRRRLVRVWIPYALWLSILFSLSLVGLARHVITLREFLGHIALFDMFDSDRYFSVGFEYWFMFPLFQFYLMFPVIAWARRRCTNAKTFGALCTTVSIGWLCLLYFTGLNSQSAWNSAAPVFMWEFGLGIVAAEAFASGHRAYWELAPSWLATILLLGAGLTGGMALYGGSIGKMLNDAPSFVTIFAAAALVHQTLALWPAAQRMAVHFGQWSYSLYLTHMLALSIASTIVPNGMLPVVIALPLAVIMAWAFQRLVDVIGRWCSKGTLVAQST